ncbi:MAG: heparan-alpha-glucosaminide N-acetyltransferase domain-containing protein [Gemmatimonadaceae bacterium]
MSTAPASHTISTRYDATTPSVAPHPTARERLVSLDVFRGITIAGMLLVNDPGTWSAIFPPLEHAAWDGWTPTDLIFPFFLFIVGITTHLSMSARRARGDDDSALVKQILRRGIIIYLLGFAIAMFPFYQWGTIDSLPNATAWDRIIFRIEHVRILGVLPRIGIVYICAGLLTLKTTLKQQIVIVAALLFGYWFAMTLIPVPGENAIGAVLLHTKDRNLAAYLDRLILGTNHTWIGSVTFDPEGPMSTLPAIGTAMLGVLAGRWIALKQKSLLERITGLFAAGSIGMMLGLMWNWSFPINKNLWTSSYVIFTAGMACVALATIMWVVDFCNVKWWTKPFVVFGVNPIVAFVGSSVIARLIYTLWHVNYNGTPTAVQDAIYQSVFLPWLPPRVASLAFAICFVLLWYGVLLVLYRRKIILKV